MRVTSTPPRPSVLIIDQVGAPELQDFLELPCSG